MCFCGYIDMYVFAYKTISKRLKKKVLLFQGEIQFIQFNTLATSIAKETQSLYVVPAPRAGCVMFTVIYDILQMRQYLWKLFQVSLMPTPRCEPRQVWEGLSFRSGLFLVKNGMSGSAVNLKEDAVVSEEKILHPAENMDI